MRDRWLVPVAVFGIAGVSWYVASWAVAGWLAPGYDPVRQSISELFAAGAPALPSRLVTSSLIGSGAALVAFAFALHRGLPGDGLLGPLAAGLSGVMTVAVVVVPYSPGCPGTGTTTTDTLHTLVAAVGYLALILTPILVAVRVRGHDPRFARWSLAIGGVALVGLLLHASGRGDPVAGLLQRGFNTVADLWYVLAAVAIIARVRRADATLS